VKSTLRGAGTRLRGQTPALAAQEIWGLLTVYNALVDLTVAAAVVLDVDPDEISFATVLALTRTSADTDPGCIHCGHRPDNPVDDLVTVIAVQPRNRTTRQRTSPRTKPNDEPNEHATSATPPAADHRDGGRARRAAGPLTSRLAIQASSLINQHCLLSPQSRIAAP
jgi:hypothetical protein